MALMTSSLVTETTRAGSSTKGGMDGSGSIGGCVCCSSLKVDSETGATLSSETANYKKSLYLLLENYLHEVIPTQ